MGPLEITPHSVARFVGSNHGCGVSKMSFLSSLKQSLGNF